MELSHAVAASAEALARAQQERDFYRRLLELGSNDEIEPLVKDALSLIVTMAGARRGYIELLEARTPEGVPCCWMAHGCHEDQIEEIRAAFSTGVIAEAITTGETVLTESAVRDPRFFKSRSVKRNQTEAVLCAPIGKSPPLGVVYLQDREGAGPFTEADREHVETFAWHVAGLADRLLLRRKRSAQIDHTGAVREGLRLDGFIGRSAAIARVLKRVAQAAPRDVGVLLSGPSGTGKTQLARVLHDNSPRAHRPFIELNCSALPESLIESELFGALPGAHSTAVKRIEGKVTAANGGTLFLDEIAELRLPSQAKLLQLLESREYFPLGSAKPLRADVRIIAATNADLKSAVLRKEFREDLFYRLQVMHIRVPPLAERPEDIADLAEHLVDRSCAKNKIPAVPLSSGALSAIAAADWPGNIRELSNVLEAAVIQAAWEGAGQVERRHVFPEEDAQDGDPARDRPLTLQEATRRFQKQFVSAALDAAGWNVTEAARRLDLTRAHVYNLIRAFGLSRRP